MKLVVVCLGERGVSVSVCYRVLAFLCAVLIGVSIVGRSTITEGITCCLHSKHFQSETVVAS